jgi:hypothetical protein
MEKHPTCLILFLIGIVLICGCTRAPLDTKPEPVLDSNTTLITTTTTALPSTTITPKDPIIGTWISYTYPPTGRLEIVYNFIENNTWIGADTNLKNMLVDYSHGIWRKESDGNYWIKSSITGNTVIFEYNITKNQLYDPVHKQTFHRTAIAVKEPSPSLLTPGLLESKNFSYVVENLDTPEKAAQYAQAKFIFEYHSKCISYSPEEFFKVIKGDCKDYATFISYILAQHGYDAKIVSFKYYKGGGGNRSGHVVALFTDTDGRMRYATTPDVSILRDVNSVDDLLTKESSRLDGKIANYTVLPAGSLDVCVV